MSVKNKKEESEPHAHVEVGAGSPARGAMIGKIASPGKQERREPDGAREPTEAERKKARPTVQVKVGKDTNKEKAPTVTTLKSVVIKANKTKELLKRNKIRSAIVHRQNLNAPPRDAISQANREAAIAQNKSKTEISRSKKPVSKHWDFKEHHMSAHLRNLTDTLYPPDKKNALDQFGHNWRKQAEKLHKTATEKWISSGRKGGEPHLHDFKYKKTGIMSLPKFKNVKDSSGNVTRKQDGYDEHYHKATTARFPTYTPSVKEFHHEVSSYRALHPLGNANNKKLVKVGSKNRLMSSGVSTTDLSQQSDLLKLKARVKEHKTELDEIEGHIASHKQDIKSAKQGLLKANTWLNHSTKLLKSGHRSKEEHQKIVDEVDKRKKAAYDKLDTTRKALADTLAEKGERLAHLKKAHKEASKAVKSAKDQDSKLSHSIVEKAHATSFVKHVKEEHGAGSSPDAPWLHDYYAAKEAWPKVAGHTKDKTHPAYQAAHKTLHGDPKGATANDRKGILGRNPKSRRFFTSSTQLYGAASKFHKATLDYVKDLPQKHAAEGARLKIQGDALAKDIALNKKGLTRRRGPFGKNGLYEIKNKPSTPEDNEKLNVRKQEHAKQLSAHSKSDISKKFKTKYQPVLDHHAKRYVETKSKDDSYAASATANQDAAVQTRKDSLKKIRTSAKDLRERKEAIDKHPKISKTDVTPKANAQRRSVQTLKDNHAKDVEEHNKLVDGYNKEHSRNEKHFGEENRNERGLNTEKGHGVLRKKKSSTKVIATTKLGTATIKRVKPPLVENKLFASYQEKQAKKSAAKSTKSTAKTRKVANRSGKRK